MEADGVEYTARTVEEAVSAAEQSLGASRDELHVEVVSQGSRGVFGIGAEPARIRARRRSAPEPVQQPAQSRGEVAVAAAPRAQAPPEVEEEDEHDAAESSSEQEEGAAAKAASIPEDGQRVLQELLVSMGIEAQVSIRETEEPVVLGITGRNLGVLIGRRGDNLAALQFMVNLILSKNRRQWPRVVIDVENYRARREESLRTLADRIAYRVHRNRRPFTLEAMPAGDRRIIHLALRDRQDVETYSIGEGAARRVVVAPKRAQ